jgi:hypothetical protein
LSILSWIDFEDTPYSPIECILRGLHPVRKRPAISIVEIKVPVQLNILDLSLFLCYLFFSNYYLYKKISNCLSEQNGCSAQLWASLVHYKSRL